MRAMSSDFFALIGVLAILLGMHAAAVGSSVEKALPLICVGLFWVVIAGVKMLSELSH